jgi:hypothetical protein
MMAGILKVYNLKAKSVGLSGVSTQGFQHTKEGGGMSSPTHTLYTPSSILPAWQLPTRRQKLPI